jgi:serine/threonine-protein kinase
VDQLKSYRILAKIGEGGMGEVFLAEHLRLGRKVAIKFLSPALSAHTHAVSRFFAEARAAAQLNSPGIVQIFDCDANPDGRAFIVMEYLEGETLADRLSRGSMRPDVRTIVEVGIQIAAALSVAHGRGIVHRDLKPANIFLTGGPGDRPTVKLLDFGIAKLTDESTPGAFRTVSGEIVGTPAYMSPEQCRGKGAVDARSDIYSLGCVLYEMLCGRRVFDAGGVGEWISAHMNERPVDPAKLVPGSPPALTSLILGALEKHPDQRPPSAAVLAEQLARLLPAGAAQPSITAPLVTARRSAVSRFSWPVLLLGALAAGGWLMFRWSRESTLQVPAAPARALPDSQPTEAVVPDLPPSPPPPPVVPVAEPPRPLPAAAAAESSRRPPRTRLQRRRTTSAPADQKRPPDASESYYRPVED